MSGLQCVCLFSQYWVGAGGLLLGAAHLQNLGKLDLSLQSFQAHSPAWQSRIRGLHIGFGISQSLALGKFAAGNNGIDAFHGMQVRCDPSNGTCSFIFDWYP